MQSIFREHAGFWNKERKESLWVGIFLLALAMVLQTVAGGYSVKKAGNFVGDLFLDNIPTMNLDYIIVNGAFLMIITGFLLLALKPSKLLFGLKVISVFILVRSFFISLTHIGIYPHQITLADNPIDRLYTFLNLQDGFFFSGHTGMTYLAALVFWHEKFWRYFFICVSILFGTAVLLAHVHYSIDVFAAPFMTYAIFRFSEELFPKDYAILKKSSEESRALQ